MIILFLLLASFGAEAQWSEILGAQNIEELMEAEATTHSRKRLTEGCRIEQSGKLFPISCIPLLGDHLGTIQATTENRRLYEAISRLCRTTTPIAKDKLSLQQLLDSFFTPKDCVEPLREKIKDLEYLASGDSGPDFVLPVRHEKVKSTKNKL